MEYVSLAKPGSRWRPLLGCMTYGTLKRARVRAALAWLLQNPAITAPIVGATKPYHLEDAGGALSFKLSDEEVTALKEPYVPHPLVGFE